MRILVVNDDGINAEGIRYLAETARQFGEVWVVAPDSQCSAMSQKITVNGPLVVKPVSFPVDDVKAYSVSGTPADCVKIALQHLMTEKPDLVLSGINFGYNTGYDIFYSGTVGAAMEALINGVPAIAFSKEPDASYAVVEQYMPDIIRELMAEPELENEVWNVNFPGCEPDELKGILRNRVPAKKLYYPNCYKCVKRDDEGGFELVVEGRAAKEAETGTDIQAVLDGYISIGKVKNSILA